MISTTLGKELDWRKEIRPALPEIPVRAPEEPYPFPPDETIKFPRPRPPKLPWAEPPREDGTKPAPEQPYAPTLADILAGIEAPSVALPAPAPQGVVYVPATPWAGLALLAAGIGGLVYWFMTRKR